MAVGSLVSDRISTLFFSVSASVQCSDILSCAFLTRALRATSQDVALKIRALHCSVWSRERFRVLAASLTVQLGVNGNFFLLSTNVRTVMALSLKLLNRKYDTGICRASAMRQYPDVHQDRWTFRSVTSHIGSAAGPSSSNHQCPDLTCVAKYCHFCGLARTNFLHNVEHQHEYGSLIKKIKILAVQIRLNVLFEVKSRCNWDHVQNHLHFLDNQVQFFDMSVFVPYVLQLCCPIVGWIWVRGSKTHTMLNLRTSELSF